ncbi:AAA family ATPase [Fastidiosipila sanguinis]|uniref:AAA family ATPase n=1 Tax=Fastidiosipila sanguinis TaxID=236753 RepID=A0A2S0KPM5_9FIRM|nr:MoxR family ATPase [Fastidiosipila sanguinis]AVM42968.1 hypothetical protein C5Q98_06980 [Fastidiosipila sanguinis]
MDNKETANLINKVKNNVNQIVIGQSEALELLLIGLVSRGHVLLEDVPGIGKTTLASSLAKSLGLDFKRIQFTPDVMPSDITGFNMYNPKVGEFQFHPGAIMTNLVLADEINRSSPKTQSSLLEAMQDRQVTVDGVTYKLPDPFMVVATQNAIDQIGTYPLPEAQLDRFMIKTNLRYPNIQEEMRIYDTHSGVSPLDNLQEVLSIEDLVRIQKAAIDVYVAPSLYEYVAQLSNASRQHPQVKLGVSPRGALMLVQAAKGRALLQGRDYIIPDDIQFLAPYCLAHRLILHQDAELSDINENQVIKDILRITPIPKA